MLMAAKLASRGITSRVAAVPFKSVWMFCLQALIVRVAPFLFVPTVSPDLTVPIPLEIA